MKTPRIRRVMAVFMCVFTLMTMLPSNHAHAGTCYECGGEIYPISTFQANYVYLGNNTHNIIMEEWVYNHCHACEMSYSGMPTGVITETIENCDIEMGRCTVCGNTFDGPCAHENAIYSDRMDEGATYVYYDADSHYGVGTYLSDKICNDCGVNFDNTGDMGLERPHEFNNGVCSRCYYVCGHESIDADGYCTNCGVQRGNIEPTWINPCLESYTRTTCTYLSAGWYENTVCSDCGERLNCVLHPEDKLYTIEHDFDKNGYCTRCTYNPNEGIGDPEE